MSKQDIFNAVLYHIEGSSAISSCVTFDVLRNKHLLYDKDIQRLIINYHDPIALVIHSINRPAAILSGCVFFY